MKAARLQIMGEHPGAMRIGRWNNIVICAWSGQPTGQAVSTLSKLMIQLHTGSTEVRSYIHMVPEHAGIPDASARSGISWIMNTYEPYIACVGVILAGSGFWASAMRNVVIGFRMMLRTPFDYRIHAHADELLSWFPAAHLQRTGVAVTGAELESLLAHARSWQTPESVLASL